ncbi:MAG: response regulator [bacterium]
MSSVLVIDDSETTQSFIDKVLSKDGHDVTCVGSWSEASEELDTTEFDLIFLDCWLPDVEGLSVIENIREHHSGTIVMISGYADRSIVQKAQNLGLEKFLEKPLDPSIIRRVTSKALDQDESDGDEEQELPEEIQFYTKPKILIVDDEEPTQQLLAHPLDHYDIPYRIANTGTEAWEIFQGFEPDVVILDALLKEGEMSSTDFFEKARKTDQECFFIGITGYPESDEINYLINEELTEFFYKPFSVTKLMHTLSHLSFVIQKRSEKPDESESDRQTETDNGSSLKQKMVIGILAVVIGLLLGFFVQWTRNITQSRPGDQLTIEKMFREIEGYLQRDERRERKKLQ